MTLKRFGLFLLRILLPALATQFLFSSAVAAPPSFFTESLRLEELPPPRSGEYRFLLSLPESYRNRHFRLKRDLSACRGPLMVNGTEWESEDFGGLLRFDRSNELGLKGCLERIPKPVEVLATPRVFIASLRFIHSERRATAELEVVVRNTLANSASCSLTAGGSTLDFLIGPETSQTHRISVRLKEQGGFRFPVELYKFEEVMEEAYRHVVYFEAATQAERPD